MIKGPPPKYANDAWDERAATIGTIEWNRYKFVFFGPDGDLYAMDRALGTLYKAPPPTDGSDGWITSATQIGKDGFGKNFNFLFFGPDTETFMPLIVKGSM